MTQTLARKRAQTRNWLKFQLMASQGNLGRWHTDRQPVITDEEWKRFQTIQMDIRNLLEDWDKNSVKLGMKVAKKKPKEYDES